MNGRNVIFGTLLFLTFALTALLVDATRPLVLGKSGQKSVHFTTAGDYGALSSAQEVLKAVNQANPDFHTMLGDFSYEDTAIEKEWCNFIKTFIGNVPTEIISGNHESSDKKYDGYIDNFIKCLPHSVGVLKGDYGKEYYFDYPNENPIARFIFVSPNLRFADDPSRSYEPGSGHNAWLENAIAEGKEKGIPWTIVSMHKVCASVGRKDCEIGRRFTNFLIDQKVDLVLQGHEHSYQRSFMLTCMKNVYGFEPDCVNKEGENGAYTKGSGTIFAIVGTGGAPLNSINLDNEQRGYFSKIFGRSQNPTYGYLDVVLDHTRLNARFVPVNTRDYKEGLSDQFNIVSR